MNNDRQNISLIIGDEVIHKLTNVIMKVINIKTGYPEPTPLRIVCTYFNSETDKIAVDEFLKSDLKLVIDL